jgi:hypothetical protein
MSKYNFDQKRNDYETPPELLYKGLKMARIYTGFECDVCCSEENIPAYHYFLEGKTDGLTVNWHGFNWCNPPFNKCKKWIKKAYEEQQKGNRTVMLLPVRTETKYWHDYILYNPKIEIQWLRKGYCFINPDTKEPMGVFKNALALVYFK